MKIRYKLCKLKSTHKIRADWEAEVGGEENLMGWEKSENTNLGTYFPPS